jgi:hypothetical protein
MARRDDRKYCAYLREKSRRQAGCPARKMLLIQLLRATRSGQKYNECQHAVVRITRPRCLCCKNYKVSALVRAFVLEPIGVRVAVIRVERYERAQDQWAVHDATIVERESLARHIDELLPALRAVQGGIRHRLPLVRCRSSRPAIRSHTRHVPRLPGVSSKRTCDLDGSSVGIRCEFPCHRHIRHPVGRRPLEPRAVMG